MNDKILKFLLLLPLYILIVWVIFVGYNVMESQKELTKKDPCWLCGMKGKMCVQVFPDKSILNDKEKVQNWLESIAENNTLKGVSFIYDSPEEIKNLNLNLSMD